MRSKELNRYYATQYRINNREYYNEYQNNYYHQNKDRLKAYRNEWRKKRVKKAKEQGIINAWQYVNMREKPIYKNDDKQ